MSLFYTKTDNYGGEVHWGHWITLFLGIVVVWTLLSWFVVPNVKVYKQNLEGQANLKQQEWEKKIQIEEAQANLEAEKLNALAEVERAKGAAEAIEIEGGSLTENYIKYLWVRQLATGEKQLIYIPTEAGLPILEAGRITN